MAPADDDDLAQWRDDPLVRALTAGGSAAELAGEDAAVAAFRAAARRPRRRHIGRLGTGATTIVVAVALSGGVAAAYTHSLPEPLQSVAHGLLGPVGVPAPAAPHHPTRLATVASGPGHARTLTGGAGTTPPPASPSATPTPVGPPVASRPHRSAAGPARPSPSAVATLLAPAEPSPPSSPSPSPTPSPTPSLSPTPAPPPPPAALVAAAARRRVVVGHGDRVTGRLTDANGEPVAGHRVRFFERTADDPSWHRIAVRRSGEDGMVSMHVADLTSNTRLRLGAGHGVHSEVIRIVVIPVVTATVSPDGDNYDVAVTTSGARSGDKVVLLRRRHGHWVKVTDTTLDDNAGAAFVVPIPKSATVHYRVIVRSTSAHGPGITRFTTSPSTSG
jgi:hypothetical protein